ncbi:MAG: PorT family protein, partial [Sphingobacteriales bacterium]
KIYILFTLCITFFTAQTYAQKGFHIGANASAVNSYLVDDSLYGDVSYKPTFTLGPVIGFAAGNNFTNQFGLEVEVNYARLGQGYEYIDSINMPKTVTNSGKITLDYIQVPVLLKFTGGDYKTRFSAMFGPQLGFLSSAWNRKGNSGALPAKQDFNKMDIGMLLTFGGDISLTNDLYLNLGLRFYYGFKEVNKVPYVVAKEENVNPPKDNLLNAYGGLNVGLHYLFRNNENPKNK